MGNRYVRRLLVTGMTSRLRQVKTHPDRVDPWSRAVLERKPAPSNVRDILLSENRFGTWFAETIRASGRVRRANRPDTRLLLTSAKLTSNMSRLAERFQSYLSDRLEAFPGLSARRLHREIKAMGYEGAYSTLTEYLRLIRPATPRQFERRFETPAGKQAQVDFAEFQVEFTDEPGVMRKVWLFSMVLGHSRWL